MYASALNWIHQYLFPFDNFENRLSMLNISGAIILAIVFFRTNKPNINFKKVFFNNKYWWNKSTKVDYQIYIINALLKSLFLIPAFATSYYFSRRTFWILSELLGQATAFQGTALSLILVSLFIFIWDDGLRFIHHYLMHKVSFLWEFHKVHHSAKILTPITLFRIHPLESAIATLRNSLSLGVSSAVFMFFFSGEVSLYTFFGVNVFAFIFNTAGANLRHSHVPISFGLLEYLFISPKQHQIHHSSNPDHFDKNFGVGLAIWDYMMGSLVLSKGTQIAHFGVRGLSSHKLSTQYWWPFCVLFEQFSGLISQKTLYLETFLFSWLRKSFINR